MLVLLQFKKKKKVTWFRCEIRQALYVCAIIMDLYFIFKANEALAGSYIEKLLNVIHAVKPHDLG